MDPPPPRSVTSFHPFNASQESHLEYFGEAKLCHIHHVIETLASAKLCSDGFWVQGECLLGLLEAWSV